MLVRSIPVVGGLSADISSFPKGGSYEGEVETETRPIANRKSSVRASPFQGVTPSFKI